MNGPEGAVDGVLGVLQTYLPAELTRLAATQDLVPAQPIALPKLWLSFERGSLGLDDWPAVMVTAGDDRLIEDVGFDEDDDGTLAVFEWVQQIGIILAVKAGDWDPTNRLRHRYRLAIRNVLLAHPQPKAGMRLVPTSIRGTAFSGPEQGDNRNMLEAALTLEYQMTDAVLITPAQGLFETVVVQVERLN